MYSNYSSDKTTAPKIVKKSSSKDMPASELKVTDYKTTARRPKK